jgi:DNA-binding MarR family transcriptional regulator
MATPHGEHGERERIERSRPRANVARSIVSQTEVESVVARLSAETAVWQSFLLTHRLMIERLTAQMSELHDLPLPWFDVLIHLAQAPDGRMRQADLRDSILLSESGLSRLLVRIADAGFIARETDPDDRRGVILSLTERGSAAVVAATADHLELVEQLFTDVLDDSDHAALRSILARLVERARRT